MTKPSLTLTLLLVSLFSGSQIALGKQGDGSDLPPDSQLRIGVKHRVKKCPQKTTIGDRLEVHYDGSLYSDNTKFDSSRDRGDPFVFAVGMGEVIPGWDQGLLNMCEGERRKLVVPSDLAYGDVGSPPTIKGGATLVFDIELLRIMDEESDYDMWGAGAGNPYDYMTDDMFDLPDEDVPDEF